MPEHTSDRIPYLPTEDQIKEAAARIRENWDEGVWEERIADDRFKRKQVHPPSVPRIEIRPSLPILN